jgi:hypothetical protein
VVLAGCTAAPIVTTSSGVIDRASPTISGKVVGEVDLGDAVDGPVGLTVSGGVITSATVRGRSTSGGAKVEAGLPSHSSYRVAVGSPPAKGVGDVVPRPEECPQRKT